MAGIQETLEQSVLIFDYPGFGKSEGSPSEHGCYAAADAAYDWLTEKQGIAGGHIVLLGKSLGGGVAIDLASRRPHRALVLMMTFTSVPDVAQRKFFWLPVRWLMRNRFESLDKLEHCTRPVFVVHGTADRLVPFEHGEHLFAAAKGPKQFVALEGVRHEICPDENLLRELRRFLDEQAPLTSHRSSGSN